MAGCLKGHKISMVYPDSIAMELGIEVGDYLLEVNGHKIGDVFDYRYYMKDEYVLVLIRKSNGEEWELEIEKDYDDDLGVEFENSLMSDYKSCSNKCIFCFIDQMPPGMRETLYFKDDDSRLSFLQGNYITLTNMKMEDVERITKMNLAPINISVQTTNPELRCKMLHNRFAGDKLKFLQILYENHVEMNGQIVLCKGVNDGEELKRSIDDLSKLLPFMRSVSVVPAGITKYREGLYPLELFSAEESRNVIDLIESRQKEFFDEYGLHFIHASDEWYINADLPFPDSERYDGYIQLENGVGMMRLLIDEVMEAIDYYSSKDDFNNDSKINVTIATGKLPYTTINMLSKKVMEVFDNVNIKVLDIRNVFFGETITVTGLIIGKDLVDQVCAYRDAGNELGDRILISSSMLRTGEEVFLDDLTLSEVIEAIGLPVVPVESGGDAFVRSIIDCNYKMERDNGTEGYIAYNNPEN
ncbi:MAG: DUF512 domain-containing protein [Lachnospiraceae bacterium]|nr:DUF512 domain-containing protein [Lachnoclostridium sp.]MDY2599102.1 DUF512 domain-containing protein [Lachnospiraceae bacterium]